MRNKRSFNPLIRTVLSPAIGCFFGISPAFYRNYSVEILSSFDFFTLYPVYSIMGVATAAGAEVSKVEDIYLIFSGSPFPFIGAVNTSRSINRDFYKISTEQSK